MDSPLVFEWIRHAILLGVLTISAYTDLKYGKLFNWCTIPAAILGLFAHFLQGHLVYQSFWNPLVLQSLLGLMLGFGLFFLLYLSGGFGAGDMKLAAAIGALMGWRFLLEALVYISLVGAAMAIGTLIWHGQLWSGLKRSAKLLVGRREKDAVEEASPPLTIPYGLAIAVGTLWAYWMALLLRL